MNPFNINTMITTIGITAVIVGLPAYLQGRADGKAKCEAAWKKGIENLKDDVKEGEARIDAIPDKTPSLKTKAQKQKIELSMRSQRKMGKLEGKIDDLLFDLENAKRPEGECGSRGLPDDVIMRHDKLDRLMEGESKTRHPPKDPD